MRVGWDCDKSDSNVIAMVFRSYWAGLSSDSDALVVELWEVEGWRMTKEQNHFAPGRDGSGHGRKKGASFQARKVPTYALV